MRYRHVWPGVLLVSSLAMLLVGLILWGDHFLSPGPSGGIRRLLELWAAPRDQDVATAPNNEETGPAALADILHIDGEDGADVATASATVAGHPDDLTILPAAEPHERPARARPPRYSLELGTFALVEEAERAEAQLNEAGFSTVRFRQRDPARLYTVTIEGPVAPGDRLGVVDQLRQEGFGQAAIVGSSRGSLIRIEQDLPFRSAVEVAERLRSSGHDARVWAEAAHAGHLTLRHGMFSSRAEAEAAARAIARLGVSPEVVEVR